MMTDKGHGFFPLLPRVSIFSLITQTPQERMHLKFHQPQGLQGTILPYLEAQRATANKLKTNYAQEFQPSC